MTPLERLKELAKRATQGKWRWENHDGDPVDITEKRPPIRGLAYGSQEILIAFDYTIESNPNDLAFIAACNPRTIIALLELLEHYKKEYDGWTQNDSDKEKETALIERVLKGMGV